MGGLILLIAFIAVPLAEIAVFIKVGGWVGLGPTILLILATAVLGTVLLRQQGLSTLGRARAELEANSLPVRELFHGACLLFAGALLLTPGFITDFVGFLLLLPPVREILRLRLLRQLERQGATYTQTGEPHQGGASSTIDGEFHELDDQADQLPPGNRDNDASPWNKS